MLHLCLSSATFGEGAEAKAALAIQSMLDFGYTTDHIYDDESGRTEHFCLTKMGRLLEEINRVEEFCRTGEKKSRVRWWRERPELWHPSLWGCEQGKPEEVLSHLKRNLPTSPGLEESSSSPARTASSSSGSGGAGAGTPPATKSPSTKSSEKWWLRATQQRLKELQEELSNTRSRRVEKRHKDKIKKRADAMNACKQQQKRLQQKLTTLASFADSSEKKILEEEEREKEARHRTATDKAKLKEGDKALDCLQKRFGVKNLAHLVDVEFFTLLNIAEETLSDDDLASDEAEKHCLKLIKERSRWKAAVEESSSSSGVVLGNTQNILHTNGGKGKLLQLGQKYQQSEKELHRVQKIREAKGERLTRTIAPAKKSIGDYLLLEEDYYGRSTLHLACELGLPGIAKMLSQGRTRFVVEVWCVVKKIGDRYVVYWRKKGNSNMFPAMFFMISQLSVFSCYVPQTVVSQYLAVCCGAQIIA